MTRASTPGSLSTSTANACGFPTWVCGFLGDPKSESGVAAGLKHSAFMLVSLCACPESNQRAALGVEVGIGDRLVRGFVRQQHLVMRLARRDHREAVVELGDAAVEDHRRR